MYFHEHKAPYTTLHMMAVVVVVPGHIRLRRFMRSSALLINNNKNNEGRIEEHGLFRHIYMIGTNFLLSEKRSTCNRPYQPYKWYAQTFVYSTATFLILDISWSVTDLLLETRKCTHVIFLFIMHYTIIYPRISRARARVHV